MRTALHVFPFLPLLPVVAAVGCGASPPQGPARPVAPAIAQLPGPCERALNEASAPRPLALVRSGSSVALAELNGRVLAYVADEDDQAVHVVDVDSGRDLSAAPVGGKPSQLMFLRDGRLVVAVRDKAQLAVLEPGPDEGAARLRCSVATDAEPYGLAASPDDGQVLVTSGWGRTLASYDAKSASLTRSWLVAVPREPRAIVVSDDGAKAFVAHAVGGQMSVVDLRLRRVVPQPMHWPTRAVDPDATPIVRDEPPDDGRDATDTSRRQSCQGFALAKTENPNGRVLLPQALVDAGDPEETPSGYGEDEDTEVGDVAVVDGSSGDLLKASLVTRSAPLDTRTRGCVLPRAAAYDAKRGSLLVGCFGVDAVIAYDASAASPVLAEQRRWSVASGPSGIALDAKRDRAVVWSQFERVVDVVPLGGPGPVEDRGPQKPVSIARIAMAPLAHPQSTALALGRMLFHLSEDKRISSDGRACASCHPDGRDDGLTWSTPHGPRRSMMLAGRVDEATPFSWSGKEHTFKDHVAITFTRLHGDGGLKSMELEALAQYVSSLPPPAATTHAVGDKVARGSEIFHSAAAGCSTCHAGDQATDNLRHDVQSKTQADRSGKFNTPSLRFVGGGGPYFHDGRYATLHELLTDSDRKMGHTAQLIPEDIEALEAYVRSL